MPRLRGQSVTVATEKILKKIENYELMTGSIVSDLELSREFEMSRTPIREAIMNLIDNGILERTTTKVVVRAIKLKDIREILQVRAAIEQKSISIVIAEKKFNHNVKTKLLRIHNEISNNISIGDFDSNFSNDEEFHRYIIELTENNRFLDIYDRLTLQSQRLRWMTMLTPNRYAETITEHMKIIQALIDGDSTAGKAAVQEHLNNTEKNYECILENPQWNRIAQEMKFMKEASFE